MNAATSDRHAQVKLYSVSGLTPGQHTITVTKDTSFALVFRFGMIPLFLFSGTFFPVTQLPGWIRPVAYATPLWHGVALCRMLSLGDLDAGSVAIHVGYLVALTVFGLWLGGRTYSRRLYV